MKILLLLIPAVLFAQTPSIVSPTWKPTTHNDTTELGPIAPPKVSDASKAAYTKALQDVNTAQANSIQLATQIVKAQADAAKAMTDANEAAQKALIGAQADCGPNAQLDGKALQDKGELACVVKITTEPRGQ